MTGVEEGLEAMLPLIEQRIAKLPAAPEASAGPSRTLETGDGEELVEELGH
jgi:hypothetical protein